VAVPIRTGAAVLTALSLAACSPLRGYPADPEDTATTLASLQDYFRVEKDTQYNQLPADSTARLTLRNEIVLSRIRAYDIEFDDFEKRLNGDANSVTAGGDLLLLILNGLGATTGAAATKAALAAASAGVVGAQAAIDKDLYYQKTLPALLAQMEANRIAVKLTILTGLNLDDSKYPLSRAELDLDTLKRAGGIPASIQTITRQAGDQTEVSRQKIEDLRSAPFNNLPSTKRILAWLFPNGRKAPDVGNFAKLQAWIDKQPPPLSNFGPGAFADNTGPDLEAPRLRAIADLQIP
jgi:hypothetical protein